MMEQKLQFGFLTTQKIIQKIGGYLNERQKVIRQYIQDNQPVKSADVFKDLPQYTQATMKKDLQYLVTEFEIEKNGENRVFFYTIKTKD